MFKGYYTYYASLSETYQRCMVKQVVMGSIMSFIAIVFMVGMFVEHSINNFFSSVLIAISICLLGNLIVSHRMGKAKN